MRTLLHTLSLFHVSLHWI